MTQLTTAAGWVEYLCAQETFEDLRAVSAAGSGHDEILGGHRFACVSPWCSAARAGMTWWALRQHLAQAVLRRRGVDVGHGHTPADIEHVPAMVRG